MDVALGIAGLSCIAMAFGHTMIGMLWVLPGLDEKQLPATPFGSRGMTASMLRVTWYIVTVFVVAVGGILLTLAWADDLDVRSMLLRWVAGMWLAATIMALGVSLPRVGRVRDLLRLPVPLVWVVVAVLCWTAAS